MTARKQMKQSQMDRLRTLVATIESPTFTAYDIKENVKQIHSMLDRLGKMGRYFVLAGSNRSTARRHARYQCTK